MDSSRSGIPSDVGKASLRERLGIKQQRVARMERDEVAAG